MNDNDFVTGTLPELTRPERTVCITLEEYRSLIRATVEAEIRTEYEQKIADLTKEKQELDDTVGRYAGLICEKDRENRKLRELLNEKTEVDNE